MKNKDIKDIAAIDQLCMYAEMELKESLLTYKTPYHIESILKADKINLETPESLQLSGQKPTSSFLKKFYSQGSN